MESLLAELAVQSPGVGILVRLERCPEVPAHGLHPLPRGLVRARVLRIAADLVEEFSADPHVKVLPVAEDQVNVEAAREDQAAVADTVTSVLARHPINRVDRVTW